MRKVISIHEYILKPDVDEDQFEEAICNAQESDLLQLPGLEEYYLVRGIRGSRKGSYAAIWIYESKEAWEKLWSPLEKPLKKGRLPGKLEGMGE